MRRFSLVAVLCAIVVGAIAFASPAAAARTVYKGQWLCDDRGTILPLGGVNLQLWHRGSPDFLPVEWVGGLDDQGYASLNGTFSLTATDPEDNHFVRMSLRDDVGVHLKDWIGINDWSIDSNGYRNNVPVQDLGGLLLSTPGQSHKCAIWRGLHLAHRDFVDLMGVNPPSGGLLIQADAPGETSLTFYTEVWWPSGFPAGWGGGGDAGITLHEFGHVIRHGYDGDFGHFVGDAATYNYARSHSACMASGSAGYAFNEGWAEYWADDYYPAPACPGIPPDDYTVEGNVAAALAGLAARCFNGNRAPMVNVLSSNPHAIHSFQEFRDHTPCPEPLLVGPAPPPAFVPIVITTAQRAASARLQVREIDNRLRSYRARLRTAERLARQPLPCLRFPCNAAMRRALLPAVLRTEVGLAQLLRRSADDGDTAAEQAAFDKLTPTQLYTLHKANQRRDRIAAARISADGIQAALSAGRNIFAKDRSRSTRKLHALLRARLASFRKAQRGATGVTGLVLDAAISGDLKHVGERVFPNPEPPRPPAATIPIPAPPSEPTKQASTLTVTCPANGKPGVYATGGTLSPAIAGATVELHITPPNAPEIVQKATTAADGSYTAGVPLQTAGTWSIFARWGGNDTTLPDDSPTCQTVVS